MRWQSTAFITRAWWRVLAVPVPLGWRCLRSLPREWGEVAVVLAAGVVPVKAKGMQMTAHRLREAEAGVHGVHGVIDSQRFSGVHRAGDAFNRLVKHSGNRYRTAQRLFLKLD